MLHEADAPPSLLSVTPLPLHRADTPPQTAYLAHVHERDWPMLHAAHRRFLDSEELAYYTSLRYPARQKSYLLGRYCAKLALAHALGLIHRHGPPSYATLRLFTIRFGIFGQPIPSAPYPTPWELSLTHHTPWAIALATPAGHPIAIDLEAISRERTETLLSQVAPTELPFVHADGPAQVTPRATLLWTAKEALSKILRCGLMIPLELLATEDIAPSQFPASPSAPSWQGFYQNFPQYQFLSLQSPHHLFTITYPKRTTLSLSPPPFLSGTLL